MRYTQRKAKRLIFHGQTIRTRTNCLMGILGEPSYDRGDELLWTMETDSGGKFSLYRHAAGKWRQADEPVVFHLLADDAATAQQASEEMKEALGARRRARTTSINCRGVHHPSGADGASRGGGDANHE